jgi:hypothetical protein
MNDSRIGWIGLQRFVADESPRAAFKPRTLRDGVIDEWFEKIAHEILPVAKPAAPQLPDGWTPCCSGLDPILAGWYEVGSIKSEYRKKNIRAWWGGTRWMRWEGLIDTSFFGDIPADAGEFRRAGLAWRGGPLDFPAYVEA